MDEFGRSSVGSDYTGEDGESDLEGGGGSSVISFEVYETASEGEGQVPLQKKERNKIKERVEEQELRCLNEDILQAVKMYKEDRKNIQKKKLSARRTADIKKIRTIVRNHKKFLTREEYIQMLKKAVNDIRGGKFLFNRNKSTLKDTLNEIIRAYTSPVSLERRRFYDNECHYTKIQRSLKAMSQLGAAGLGKLQLEEANQRVNSNNGESGSIPQNSSEIEELKKRVRELEDENAGLRSRLKVRSGGGTGESKQSRGDRTPPGGNKGEKEDPHSQNLEDSSEERGRSEKSLKTPGMKHSVNGDDSTEGPASGAAPKKGNKK